jgi:hypothetical protein
MLRQYSGCSDVVMGTTFVTRNHWKLEPLIGSLLNIAALRLELSSNPDLPILLQYVRDAVLTAFTQQEVPFSIIAPILQPDLQRTTPLFRNVFSFLGKSPNNRLQLPDLKVSELDQAHYDEMFPDLYLTIWEKKTKAGTVLKGYLQYKIELYPKEMLERMLEDFETLLGTMASFPES